MVLPITPVKFGDYSFHDQSALATECKRRISKYKVSQEIPVDDQKFFHQLFTCHPDYEEKIGCGIKTIRWGHDPVHGSKCLLIRRFDDTEDVISWRGSIRKPTLKHKVQQAFRNTVAGDVNIFKASAAFNPVTCFITGERLGFSNSRVIYNKDLSFNELVEEFLGFLDLELSDIRLMFSNKNFKASILADNELAAKWRAYHKEMAVMTLVSSDTQIKLKNTNKARVNHG